MSKHCNSLEWTCVSMLHSSPHLLTWIRNITLANSGSVHLCCFFLKCILWSFTYQLLMQWSTPSMVFLVSHTLFWDVCYVTLMIIKFVISVTSWHLAFKCATNILAWVCSIVLWGICLFYIIAYKLSKVCTNNTWHWYA